MCDVLCLSDNAEIFHQLTYLWLPVSVLSLSPCLSSSLSSQWLSQLTLATSVSLFRQNRDPTNSALSAGRSRHHLSCLPPAPPPVPPLNSGGLSLPPRGCLTSPGSHWSAVAALGQTLTFLWCNLTYTCTSVLHMQRLVQSLITSIEN